MTDQTASGWPQEAAAPTVQATDVAVEAVEHTPMSEDDRDALIRSWLEGKQNLVQATGHERQLRDAVTAELFPNAKKGTQRYVSPKGYGAIKLVFGYTFTLGLPDVLDDQGIKKGAQAQVDEVLDKIEGLGERGALIAGRIVKWRPELAVTEYEALAQSDNEIDIAAKALIDDILTVKPAAPQLTYEEPKAVKS